MKTQTAKNLAIKTALWQERVNENYGSPVDDDLLITQNLINRCQEEILDINNEALEQGWYPTFAQGIREAIREVRE